MTSHPGVTEREAADSAERRMEVLQELIHYMGEGGVKAALRCSIRLIESLPGALHSSRALVAYGGGKDSSYLVAFIRLVQLLLYAEFKKTLRLRIVTNRHAGMPRAVMENIHRVYSKLGLYEDQDVELLLVDGHEISKFDVDRRIPDFVIRRNRRDVLMTGHRCAAEARPTFCNACNLSMVNAFGMAAAYGDGIDIIMTGDSLKEQRAYIIWLRRLARKCKIEDGQIGQGFRGFVETLNSIGQQYYTDLYGMAEAEAERDVMYDVAPSSARDPFFFSIYQETPYRCADHWNILTEFLGFQFDDLAFSFTESDCANPGLMAHLRGLKAERVYSTSYETGINEYLDFAIGLMIKKDFPPHLVETMRGRYSNPTAIADMRRKMDAYASSVFGLSERQLVCMIYSPFANKGQNLQYYLDRECPRLCRQLDDIHSLLEKGIDKVPKDWRTLSDELTRISGLEVPLLRILYSGQLVFSRATNDTVQSLIPAVLADDPHKGLIQTQRSPNGPVITEILSGR
jgi:hypothetical protein